jgi:hypothetical protein
MCGARKIKHRIANFNINTYVYMHFKLNSLSKLREKCEILGCQFSIFKWNVTDFKFVTSMFTQPELILSNITFAF